MNQPGTNPWKENRPMVIHDVGRSASDGFFPLAVAGLLLAYAVCSCAPKSPVEVSARQATEVNVLIIRNQSHDSTNVHDVRRIADLEREALPLNGEK